MQIISIEGNIGAGKSSVCAELEKVYKVVQEPVNFFKRVLEHFFQDKHRHAYHLQTRIVLGFAREWDKISNYQGVVITERSALTALKVFATDYYRTVLMTNLEWDTLRELSSYLINDNNKRLKPDHMIYIHIPVRVALSRIKSRARSGEELITGAFLEQIETSHRLWFQEEENVMEVDGNQPLDYVVRSVEQVIQSLTL